MSSCVRERPVPLYTSGGLGYNTRKRVSPPRACRPRGGGRGVATHILSGPSVDRAPPHPVVRSCVPNPWHYQSRPRPHPPPYGRGWRRRTLWSPSIGCTREGLWLSRHARPPSRGSRGRAPCSPLAAWSKVGPTSMAPPLAYAWRWKVTPYWLSCRPCGGSAASVSAGCGVMMAQLTGDVPPVLRSVGGIPIIAVRRGLRTHVLLGLVQLMPPSAFPCLLGANSAFRGRVGPTVAPHNAMGREGATCPESGRLLGHRSFLCWWVSHTRAHVDEFDVLLGVANKNFVSSSRRASASSCISGDFLHFGAAEAHRGAAPCASDEDDREILGWTKM